MIDVCAQACYTSITSIKLSPSKLAMYVLPAYIIHSRKPQIVVNISQVNKTTACKKENKISNVFVRNPKSPRQHVNKRLSECLRGIQKF